MEVACEELFEIDLDTMLIRPRKVIRIRPRRLHTNNSSALCAQACGYCTLARSEITVLLASEPDKVLNG